MKQPYKLSVVNYYNTTPFLYGLQQKAVYWPHTIELDIPSVCAQKLKDNQVDIGLVPVAILPQLQQYHIITDYCIGAVGKVDSVKLFSEKPLNELTHVLLDYQSKSSVTLVQVLNKCFWKNKIEFIPANKGFENDIKDTTGAVIIGDRTFGLSQYPYEYDLSEQWQLYTGLPFVFACWVTTKKIEEEFITLFNQSLQYGVNHIEEAVAKHPKNVKGFDGYDYLKHKISYPFDENKKKGLELFLSLMKSL